MDRHQFLAALHGKLHPRTYLEVGIDDGKSLALSRVPSVGVDPDFNIRCEMQVDAHLARTSSDEFFARRRPLDHLPIDVVDLAFLDGMHLAEYALRDFLATERFTGPASVVVLDDMLPRSVAEANRDRAPGPWTGDVFKAAAVLRDSRPDLVVVEVDTTPTGVLVVLCPDAGRDGVWPGYDEWVESVVVPDPQDVPDEVLRRTRAWDPEQLLATNVWDRLRSARTRPAVQAREESRQAAEALVLAVRQAR